MKRFAVLQLSGCSGCEMVLLNAEEWIDQLDLEYMTLVMSAHDIPEVEVLLVTGDATGLRRSLASWSNSFMPKRCGAEICGI